MHFDLNEESNVAPVLKRVCIAKLLKGCCLNCSCDLHAHVGIDYVCIAAIIDEIIVYFWCSMHWKSCAFHCLHEGVSTDLKKTHEDLAFTNSPPVFYWDKVLMNHSYLVLTTNEVIESSFTDVLQSE